MWASRGIFAAQKHFGIFCSQRFFGTPNCMRHEVVASHHDWTHVQFQWHKHTWTNCGPDTLTWDAHFKSFSNTGDYEGDDDYGVVNLEIVLAMTMAIATTRATTVVMTTKVTVGWRWRRRWRWRWRLKGYYRHFCRHRRRHQAYSCQLRRHRHRHRRRCCICHCRSTYNAYNLVNVVIAIAIAYHNYRILYHCFYNRRRHAIALVFFWERLSRKSPNQSPSPSLLQIRSYVTDAFPLV